MSREALMDWLMAVLLVALTIAIPWVIGYIALAMGA